MSDDSTLIKEAIAAHLAIDKLSDDLLTLLEEKFKTAGLTGKNYLLVVDVLTESLAKLLTVYTTEPEKVAKNFVIPSLLDRVYFQCKK